MSIAQITELIQKLESAKRQTKSETIKRLIDKRTWQLKTGKEPEHKKEK